MARAYLIDLDGTLMIGGRPSTGAADMVSGLAGRFIVVSNDAEHTPPQLSLLLRRRGLDVGSKYLLLAGTETVKIVARERPGARVLLLASASLSHYAAELGLVPTDVRPDCVILARDRRFDFDRLTRAANAVRGGAELIVANPDLNHPAADGRVVPETGALLAALLACSGQVPYRVVGKPEPYLFASALARLGVSAGEALMIGDNPDTDGRGAAALGIPFLQVRPGHLPSLQDADYPKASLAFREARLHVARP